MRRRTYLTSTTATALALSVAGCFGNQDPDDEGNGDDEPSDNDTDDVEPDEEVEDDNESQAEGEDEDEDGDEEEDDEGSDLVGTFDDFEDLGAWEAVAGTLEADGERASVGSQSARLTASESESQIRIKRELSGPIDVREVVPGLALAATGSASPIIQLHDEDGNYLQFQQFVHEERPFDRLDFGHTDVSGDPDLSAITEIQIGYWTGEESEGEIWVDDLHFTSRVEEGRVMIQFQGGFESDYTRAFPIMEEYDLTGTTFVATSRIRESEDATGDRMTEDQLVELVDAGWSVGTVGARGLHLNRVEADEVESDILDPLEWFDEQGYDDAQYFGFSGGWYTPEMYDLVAENYDIAWAGRHMSQGVAANPYNLTRISGHEGQRNLDAEEMIAALDWTAERGGITTIVFYEMDESDAAALEETAAHLAELRAAGDLELIAPNEIADEYVM
ncbi:polysaccharide deacetylase family protein [Halomontanus rarus]|uniref:polysaccharide deacetylase family protein n=1 Tax=Halomontanus rarus TaxID=3034020 RepID=UPI003CE5373C